MGYYTKFELDIYSGDDCITNYREVISEHVDYDPFDEPTKWYEFEKEMKEVSKEHPKVVFEIYGKGEEYDDTWKAYFKDGKMQMCKAKIEYDDFNESLMK
ncbi:hypothetical protein Phi19:3_gp040 [Cellulophaga phage phi19:3]|uniref:Uncharacterized protein n=1 Tax=Cellulophaga phage phi19:3 TaxID=1327971 RepID=R9ZW76_9CAUD|nr:hypothetical protein Phi19:3_gp040 [Cellulophaga phage phi19:3]AGO47444.1 hypothetical protein Phi19:3_gp040 [Cellulophaga phage phi19:3]